MLLHLINYDARSAAVRDVQVQLRLPRDARAAQVGLLSPDAEGSAAVETRAAAGAVVFTVPEVKVYTVAAVTW